MREVLAAGIPCRAEVRHLTVAAAWKGGAAAVVGWWSRRGRGMPIQILIS